MTGGQARTRRQRESPSPSMDKWEEWMNWEDEAEAEGTSAQKVGAGKGTLPISSLSPQSPKKRKFPPEDIDDKRQNKMPNPVEDKAVLDRSHSIVEKRYRENLNQKIADLGDCIPSLQAGGRTSQNGTSPSSQKRNKATVLTEAMSYIQQLQKRNAYLEEANRTMNEQMQRQDRKNIPEEIQSGDAETTEHADDHVEESVGIVGEFGPQSEPRGLIPVPDEMRRLWRNQSQEHYAGGTREPEETSLGSFRMSGGKYISRMAFGSLAGFMVLNGFVKTHGKHEKREDRGLSAIPMPYLSTALHRVGGRYHGFPIPPSTFMLSYFSRAFLVFSALGFTLFLYLYYSRPPPPKSKTRLDPQPAPSAASPLEVRQNAWLTSIQTVWVPRHHILPEMLALNLETAAYLIRKALGWRCYLWLTGRTEEEEIADIRAWDIALDAQLSGGDPEISKGRLVLTLWAAGTLPDTPARLMLKALHIRILFWQPSQFEHISRMLHGVAILLARTIWRRAITMQDRLTKSLDHAGLGQNDPLPDHLHALLEQSPEEVLHDAFIRRSHNIVWNRQNDDETTKDAIGSIVDVDDSAMQGPLDLIASWFSNSKLQSALLTSLTNTNNHETIASDIDLAIRTASPRSTTSACALIAKAVLLDAENSDEFFSQMKWALPPDFPTSAVKEEEREQIVPQPSTSPSSSSSFVDTQILIAAHCHFALALTRGQDPVSAMNQVSAALRLISRGEPASSSSTSASVGLLGAATLCHTLQLIFLSDTNTPDPPPQQEISSHPATPLGHHVHVHLHLLRKQAQETLDRLFEMEAGTRDDENDDDDKDTDSPPITRGMGAQRIARTRLCVVLRRCLRDYNDDDDDDDDNSLSVSA